MIQQAQLTRCRAVVIAAPGNAAPVNPDPGAAPPVLTSQTPHLTLSPRTATGLRTSGFQVGIVGAPAVPDAWNVWAQDPASGFWLRLFAVTAYTGEWITACDVNAMPLYFEVGALQADVMVLVAETGSAP